MKMFHKLSVFRILLLLGFICFSKAAPSCRSGEFTCTRGSCIPTTWRCDGENDCIDNSDEENCDTIRCRGDKFQCGDQRCIPFTYLCNGIEDCVDGSDETMNCPTSLPEECNNKTHFNCGNKTCIPIQLVCNNQNDCGQSEDEAPDMCLMINECLQNNGGCSDLCVDDAIGFHCECHVGYHFHNDSGSCIDIDECQIPGSCSQLCNNTEGGFVCSCLEGYRVDPLNDTRCIAESGHAALLYKSGLDLLMLDIETRESEVIVSGKPVSIDYDFERKLILWSTLQNRSIYRISLQNGTTSEKSPLVKNEEISSAGLAMDWIHGNVYWTDENTKSVSVASLDGKMRKLLFQNNISKPRAIVVNPLEGWLFWSDWGKPAKIERGGMDGTFRSAIVSENILWPNGLAIDLVARKLIWADAKFHTLCSSDYDGSNVKVILSSYAEVRHPFALDVFEDWLYFSDWGDRSIKRVDKFTGTNVQTIASELLSPMGIKVYHSYKQPKGINYCGNTYANCTHFCLPAPQVTVDSKKFSCVCPDGMVLNENTNICITAEK